MNIKSFASRSFAPSFHASPTYQCLAALHFGLLVVVIRGAIPPLVIPQGQARLSISDDIQVTSIGQVVGESGVAQVATTVLQQLCGGGGRGGGREEGEEGEVRTRRAA